MRIAQACRNWLAIAALAAGAFAPAADLIAAEIVVGQVAPLTGLDAKQGRSYAAGLQLAFDLANRSGAAQRHTFRLESMDDMGQAGETVRVTRKLLDEKRPMVLSGYIGGQGLREVVHSGLLEKNGLALVGYRSAEPQAPHPLLFSTRADLRDEFDRLTRHLSTVGWRKVGLLYEDGPGSAEALALAESSAARAGLKYVARFPVDATLRQESIAKAVRTFLSSEPQAIVIAAGGGTTGAFIERYRGEGGVAPIFAQSSADVEQLTQRLGHEQMRGLVISQVTPNPYKVTTALSKTFNDALKGKPGQEPSFTTMEGFIAGRVIVEAVRKLGASPTRQAISAALDSLGEMDLGGYVVGFSPSSHTGSHFVELSIVSDLGKVRQ